MYAELGTISVLIRHTNFDSTKSYREETGASRFNEQADQPNQHERVDREAK